MSLFHPTKNSEILPLRNERRARHSVSTTTQQKVSEWSCEGFTFPSDMNHLQKDVHAYRKSDREIL